MFESPADNHINDLIETLCRRASRIGCRDDERETLVDQIAKLRSSQNPTIQMNRN